MIKPIVKDVFFLGHKSDPATIQDLSVGQDFGIGKGIRISWPEDVREAYKQYLQGIVDSL